MSDLEIPKSIRYVFEELILDSPVSFSTKEKVLNKLGFLQKLAKQEEFYFKLLFDLEYSEATVLNIVNAYAASIDVPSISTINKERWHKFIYPRYNKKQQLWYWAKRLKASKENITKSNILYKQAKYKNINLFLDDLLAEKLEDQELLLKDIYKNIFSYRKAVTFCLSPNVLPLIAGYDKLCSYGWYSKNNILGMTKDHRVSVHYGFNNRIKPAIIAHPANCEFMSLRENSSKNYRSSISLDILLADIEIFTSRQKTTNLSACSIL